MAVDPELLEILACPNCKTPVTLVKNGTALKCATCKRVYPIKDDIPVMLIDEATIEKRVVGEPASILLVRLRQIGDVVFTTPAVRALRRAVSGRASSPIWSSRRPRRSSPATRTSTR